MEDVLVEDQTLQDVLGHGDFGGFDNDGIDFRHLEDYINGDDDATLYFPESLVGSEVKNPEPSGNSGHKSTSGSIPGVIHPHSPNSLIYGLGTNLTLKNGNGQLGNGYAHPHHLPDSPPDSGSEPPYSPPDDGSNPHISLTGSLQDMLLPPMSGRKQILPYPNTQPMKHLPPLNIPQPSLQHSTPSVMLQPQPLPHPVLQVSPQHTGAPASTTQTHQQHHLSALSTDGSIHPQNLVPAFGNVGRAPSFPSKKRKLSEVPPGGSSTSNNSELLTNGIVHIKQEPGSGGVVLPPPPQSQRHCLSPDQGSNQSGVGANTGDDDLGFDFGSDSGMAFVDSAYQCIRFQHFQQSSWHPICDANLKELPTPNYRVDADKGFNYSNADEAFVCQKKNHFQVTVHAQLAGEPQYVKTSEGLKKIDNFYLHFYGCKVESPSQTIKVEQSQSDRSKKPFHPVLVELSNEQMLKITVGRLHFSETTSNNMRKKGKPNPDQRYFYLVVGLHAHCGEHNYPLVSQCSERIIVRASNPGQFESEVELSWQKGHTPESIFHAGRVGVNTDRPDESLVVHGNVKVTGHVVQPSDVRAKEDITEVDTKEQLRNLQQLRIVRYVYNDDFAQHAGLQEDERADTGVIAQEVQKVIPDAVKDAGDIVLPNGQRIDNFLVVNKERIFMENIGAVKELCKVTDNLGNRIDELERMNSKLSKLKRIDSLKSTSSGSTATSIPSSTPAIQKKPLRRGGRHRHMAEQGLCSNKFVQGTIIVLILVMAMCLIAMATLYILEWQKRQIYDFPTTPSPSTDSTMYSSNFTTTQMNMSGSYPFTSSGPSKLTTTLPVRSNSSTVMIQATSSSYSVRAQGRPDPIGAPSYCIGSAAVSNHRCKSFCCSNKRGSVAFASSSSGGGTSGGTRNSSTNRQSTSSVVVTPVSITNVSAASTTTTTPEPTTTVTRLSSVVVTPSSYQIPSNHVNYQNSREVERSTQDNRLPDSDNESSRYTYTMVIRRNKPHPAKKMDKSMRRKRNSNEQRRRVTRRNSDLASLVTGVHLVEFNHSISSAYCSNCKNGNFTYNIPVSRYMINEFLTLKFSLSSAEGVFIDYCQTGNKITEECSLINQGSPDSRLPDDSTNERKANELTPSWKLPIGKFVESSYKFRVSRISTHRRACVADADVQNANFTFVEYNFVFYRTCSE